MLRNCADAAVMPAVREKLSRSRSAIPFRIQRDAGHWIGYRDAWSGIARICNRRNRAAPR
jgi:hypothetical protein